MIYVWVSMRRCTSIYCYDTRTRPVAAHTNRRWKMPSKSFRNGFTQHRSSADLFRNRRVVLPTPSRVAVGKHLSREHLRSRSLQHARSICRAVGKSTFHIYSPGLQSSLLGSHHCTAIRIYPGWKDGAVCSS